MLVGQTRSFATAWMRLGAPGSLILSAREEDMLTKRFDVATFNTYNLVLPDVTFYETKKYSKA